MPLGAGCNTKRFGFGFRYQLDSDDACGAASAIFLLLLHLLLLLLLLCLLFLRFSQPSKPKRRVRLADYAVETSAIVDIAAKLLGNLNRSIDSMSFCLHVCVCVKKVRPGRICKFAYKSSSYSRTSRKNRNVNYVIKTVK